MDTMQALAAAFGTSPFTLQQARNTGVSRDALRHAVATGRLVRIGPSVFAASPDGRSTFLDRVRAPLLEPLAAEARERHARLAALPPELLSVRSMTAEGKLLRAEQLCRSYLKQHPQHVEGMRLLADLGVKSGGLAATRRSRRPRWPSTPPRATSAPSTSALPATRSHSSFPTTIPLRSGAPSPCAPAQTPQSSPTATWSRRP